VTQQNAALVEESAAAAESLRLQAHGLVGVVAVFKLRADEGAAVTSAKSVLPAQRSAMPKRTNPPAPSSAAAKAPHGDAQWAAF